MRASNGIPAFRRMVRRAGDRARQPRGHLTVDTARILAILILAGSPAAAQAQPTAPAGTTSPESAEPTSPRAPLPPPGELARCKWMIDAGLNIAARARLEPIVEQHPSWARAISLLALTYYKENRFEPARALFARALAADPEEIAIRPVYGWTLYSLGELDDAETMFESLLERMPEYAAAHYALGVIHLDRDEVDSARRRFETAVRLAAEQQDRAMEGRARARLGDIHVRLDDLAQAKRELELAVELFPDEYDALFKLSRVLQRLGDPEGAEEARRRFEEVKARVRPENARRPG